MLQKDTKQSIVNACWLAVLLRSRAFSFLSCCSACIPLYFFFVIGAWGCGHHFCFCPPPCFWLAALTPTLIVRQQALSAALATTATRPALVVAPAFLQVFPIFRLHSLPGPMLAGLLAFAVPAGFAAPPTMR